MAPEQAAADPKADHRVDLYASDCRLRDVARLTAVLGERRKAPWRPAYELPAPLAARRYDIPPRWPTPSCATSRRTERSSAHGREITRVLEGADAIMAPSRRFRQRRLEARNCIRGGLSPPSR